MATYYFSSSTGSNTTGDGSQGNPWGMFKGKADGTQFLAAGDSCLFKAGDTWVASSAEVIVNSSGSSVSHIVIGTYGAGAKPIFAGAPITSVGWVSTGVSSIYVITNQTQTHLKVVTQADTMGLGLWRGTTSNLPAGTFIRSGSSLYVHLWNDADPSVSNVRIASFAHSSSADGARGLVSSSRANGSRGCYVDFQNLVVICANGVGFSASGSANIFTNCQVMGAGADGVLFYSELTGSGENADSSRWVSGDISYGAASGTGFGQGFTTYASNIWVVDSFVHDNFMAGIDFLDFGANSNVTQCGALRNTVYNNGAWQDNASSYDPNIYVDGGNNIFLYGNIVYNGGKVTGATNARAGISIGSEHAGTKPCYNVIVANNLVYSNHWSGIEGNNAGATTSNILNITIANNTVIANLAGTFDQCWDPNEANPTSGNWVVVNNVFIAGSNGTCRAALFLNTASYLSMDYNLYWQIGGGANIYKSNNNEVTLAQLQGTNLDTHSVRSDPLLTTLSDTAPDVHLGASSPAIQLGKINPYTPPAWLPADLFPFGGGIRGVARSDGTVDPASSALDAGYHYLSGANTSGSSTKGNGVTISLKNTTVRIGQTTVQLAVA